MTSLCTVWAKYIDPYRVTTDAATLHALNSPIPRSNGQVQTLKDAQDQILGQRRPNPDAPYPPHYCFVEGHVAILVFALSPNVYFVSQYCKVTFALFLDGYICPIRQSVG
jgi:hypothetical protein